MKLLMKSLLFVIFVTLGVLFTSNRVNGSGQHIIANAEFNHNVQGVINFIFDPSNPGGDVMIVAIFDSGHGLEKGKEYPFHIHENAIKNNDCETAGGHLDPDGFGKDPNYKCERSNPEKCEVGDLSGKYGDLIPDDDGNVIKKDYDAFITLDGPSGITGRSVVIHLSDANLTRYDCANIIVQGKQRKRNHRFVF